MYAVQERKGVGGMNEPTSINNGRFFSFWRALVSCETLECLFKHGNCCDWGGKHNTYTSDMH